MQKPQWLEIGKIFQKYKTEKHNENKQATKRNKNNNGNKQAKKPETKRIQEQKNENHKTRNQQSSNQRKQKSANIVGIKLICGMCCADMLPEENIITL